MTFMLAAVGPMSFGEHIAWFFVLTLVLCLTYDGLRAESVSIAVKRGLRRWVMFGIGTVVLGAAFHLLVRSL
ncbi:MAG: hypothetical protein P8N09_02190 [Planctomycetota bacterium]|jgi:hypothetical protein|nr:hypothetical protein [Planctomycetota bacterium]